MLQEEVELFNKGIKLVTKPVWLSTAENRQNKKHASAIISIATQEEAQNALRTRVVMAGIADLDTDIKNVSTHPGAKYVQEITTPEVTPTLFAKKVKKSVHIQ
ncbi:hypothetical protein LPUS_02837 [Lasallia pustulata]|uniref:Uncharacterized protein n=1 Tax=Lasallia pustulata TaxID=136370 RepID=A0A1W5CTM8_9LECA|nr:hypothetical protein LPUS_02837 [Lasallia pustulata]